jgi:SMI1 / KNR4 family (SUKH-1)
MRRYRGRVVFGPFTPVEPDEIRALESAIGQALPSAYREFLHAVSGGTLDYEIRMPASTGGESIAFTDLYQLGRDQHGGYGYGTLIGEYRKRQQCWWAEKVCLDNLMPIARDGGDDTLYFDLNPETCGRLVAFVHGLPSWTGHSGENVLAVVADSLDDYIDALHIDEENAKSTWAENAIDPANPWRHVIEDWLDDGLPDWRTRHWAQRDTQPGSSSMAN